MKRRKLPTVPAAVPDVRPKAEEPEIGASQPVASPDTDPQPEAEPASLEEQKRAIHTQKSQHGMALSAALRKKLEQIDGRDGFRLCSNADAIAAKLVELAKAGTMDAIKLIYDRTEGRVPQSLEIGDLKQKDVNERVSDIARERANAAALAAAGGALPQGEGLLEVPQDRTPGAQEARSQSGLAG